MFALTETHILKSTFFTTWKQSAQSLKMNEFTEARNSLKNFYFNSLRSENEMNAKTLAPADQFAVMKNLLLIQHEIARFFGVTGEEFFYEIQSQLSPANRFFSLEQRYILAKIDVERSALSVLEKYDLTVDQTQVLVDSAHQHATAFLPPLSDEFIMSCTSTGNHEALRYAIYNRFSVRGYRLSRQAIEALQPLLCDLNHDSGHQIVRILAAEKRTQEQNFLNFGCFTPYHIPHARPKTWSSHQQISGDTPVAFSHGVGFFHIIQFLTGKSMGYRLENPGVGIQVMPGAHTHPRDDYYASTAAPRYMDYPARLSGTILAEYLDSAPNSYEAGLRATFIDYIEDIVITRLDTGAIFRIGTTKNQEALRLLPPLENEEAKETESLNQASVL